MKRILATIALPIAFMCGCDESSEQSVGELRVTIYGESFIEDSIPPEDVIDGWAIDFSRFLIAVHDVEAGGETLDGSFVYNLVESSNGAGHTMGTFELPTGRVGTLDYRVAPAVGEASGNASVEDIQAMTQAGFSVWVQGTATRGGETKSFDWGFATDTRYVNCETTADAGDESATSQLTIHSDHLFYDDLELPEPNVAFDLIASADADANGEVTQEELAQIDLGGLSSYGVGSRPITDLWGFIVAQTTTLGHIDGEGHCDAG